MGKKNKNRRSSNQQQQPSTMTGEGDLENPRKDSEQGQARRSSTSSVASGTKSPKGAKWRVEDEEGNVISGSKFVFSRYLEEDHKSNIYDVRFHNGLKKGQPRVFATVGGNKVSVYQAPDDGSIKILQRFVDPDKEEDFYTCAWSSPDQKNILAAAGGRGVIRILEPETGKCVKGFAAHGLAINYLVFHPKLKNFLFSASKDHSLRLWNVDNEHCVVAFQGIDAHRDEVLHCDIDLTGTRMVSSGMDHALKVWKLKKPEIEQAIEKSSAFRKGSTRPLPRTWVEYLPEFTNRTLHGNYVDCAKWWGDGIFSKSIHSEIIFWKAGDFSQSWDEIPKGSDQTSTVTTLYLKECELWFVRFELHGLSKQLAVGSQFGKTQVFDLDVDDPAEIHASILTHRRCVTTIRQTAFSRDGKVLICVCDDGTIWRWNINKQEA